MELEEAIEILKEDLEHTKKANECGLATKGEFNKEIEAIEFILNHLAKQKKMIKEHEKMIIRHKEQLRKAGIYGYDYDLKVLTEESE